jgi:hypothetical protein
MATALRYVGFALTASIAAVIFACGSSGDTSGFGGANNDAGDNSSGGSSGVFVNPDGGDGGQMGCKPLTCADQKANCGLASDGCGGTIDCSGGMPCPPGTTCGGDPMKPSQCGAPPCNGKTCMQLGVECGGQNDGCGNLINCGTCESGTCGGGGPSKCGGDGSSDGGVCVPSKTACGPGDCGPQSDGCGGIISCPNSCPVGQTCGGDPMKPGQCGAPPCTKNTCGAKDCGYIADGCGGVVNCWPMGASSCPPGETCGGAGTPNTCGTPPGCTGLCLQQQGCAGGATTSVEGYVTSPNGVLPVPNAVVYVPNGTVTPFTTGVQCETCATASGSPLVSTTTDANGHFLLPNMPVSTPGKVVDIPVVVQLGRWRKKLTVQTTACMNTLIPSVDPAAPTMMAVPGAGDVARPSPDTQTAALPRNKADGDIPLTAISTGDVDGLECVFRKMGVDDAEFTKSSGTGRIRLYRDNGASPPGCGGGGCSNAAVLYGACGTCNNGANRGLACTANTDCPGSTCSNPGCTNEIDKFDATIFGCVGSQVNKPIAGRSNVLNYANKGGRVFATHYSYVWLYNQTSTNGGPNYSSAWGATTLVNKWTANDDFIQWDNSTAFIDTSFPKGVLFDNWLQAPVAPTPASYPPPYPPVAALSSVMPDMITITEPRKDIQPTAPNTATSGIVAPAQRWIYTTAAGSTATPPPQDAPLHFTFNTPLGAMNQCGRVLYSDFHVSVGSTGGSTFPNECSATFTAQEKVLAYMLFDLASCVSTMGLPMCMPKSCADQGLGCGLAGDGCGNQIDCGPCPLGQTCGGGGIASQCGAPACTPAKCMAGQCGKLGDGCGGLLDCGTCMMGTCGGGGPNMCGMGVCMPQSCPAPAMGSLCGPVADGCGGVNNCPCPMGVPCVNGTCGAPPCTPRTCMQAGANCGTIADGCGGTVMCGMCVAPQTCGGGGTANLCGGGVN